MRAYRAGPRRVQPVRSDRAERVENSLPIGNAEVSEVNQYSLAKREGAERRGREREKKVRGAGVAMQEEEEGNHEKEGERRRRKSSRWFEEGRGGGVERGSPRWRRGGRRETGGKMEGSEWTAASINEPAVLIATSGRRDPRSVSCTPCVLSVYRASRFWYANECSREARSHLDRAVSLAGVRRHDSE